MWYLYDTLRREVTSMYGHQNTGGDREDMWVGRILLNATYEPVHGGRKE